LVSGSPGVSTFIAKIPPAPAALSWGVTPTGGGGGGGGRRKEEEEGGRRREREEEEEEEEP